MKRCQPDSWDETEIDMFADEQALQADSMDSPSDCCEDTTMTTEAEQEHLRRWKAEQANKALWDFGGKMRQMQQHWRRLQEEIRQAPPKRPRRTPAPTYSGPLLLLNQQYWEKGLGANISSITGENMFGINMFGSYASLCQHMLNSGSGSGSPASGNKVVAPCSSSSNAPLEANAGGNSSKDVAPPAPAHGVQVSTRAGEHMQQANLLQDQQQQGQEEEGRQLDAGSDASSNSSAGDGATTHSSNSSCSSAEDGTMALLPAAAVVPTAAAAAPAAATAAPAAEVYDFAEIELVCRQQKLTHLPASRRFVRALRIIRAAKQQQQQELEQQQQQGMGAAQSPVQGVSLVAVV